MIASTIYLFKNIFLGLIISFFVVVFGNKYKFQNLTILLLVITCFSPIFVIGFLFDQTYMWDTIVYLKNINFIKNFNSELILPNNSDTIFFSWIYSLIPLPISDNTNNIGFYSKFIYIIFLIFLITNNYLKENKFLFLFFLFWPSAVIYSSVGLKEILTFVLTFLILINLVKDKYYYSLISLFILFILKDQNAYILSVIIFFYVLFIKLNLKKIDYIIICIPILFIILFYFIDPLFDRLNFYRFNMHVEDNVPVNQIKKLDYREVLFIFDIIAYTLNFIFAPVPGEITNFFRLAQFLENMFVVFVISIFALRSYKINKKNTIFWILALLFACAIYGMITHNPGSISRWRFPFFGTWLLIFNYLSINNKVSQ